MGQTIINQHPGETPGLKKEKKMQFTTHTNTNNAKAINGTHLQGYINCSYDALTKALGYPLESGVDDYKCDAEWQIFFNDGTVATIYNWKNGKNYLGDQGYNLCDIPQWHVGGHKPEVVERVAFLIPGCQVV